MNGQIIDPGLNRPSSSSIHQWAARPVPDKVSGRWCRVAVRAPAQANDFLISIEFHMADGVAVRPPVVLSSRRNALRTHAIGVIYVPEEAATFLICVLGEDVPSREAVISMRPLTRPVAALLLIAAQPNAIGKLALAGLRGRWGEAAKELRRVATTWDSDNWPRDYSFWLANCEPRPLPGSGTLPPGAVAALVFGDPDSAAFSATAQSVAAQTPSIPCLSASDGGAASLGPEAYAVVLQAGEMLEPGSVAGAYAELVRLGYPAIATADHDRAGADGVRTDPVLTAAPNHALMLSGVPARGAWFIRADCLQADPAISEGGLWAEPVRLAAWLRCYRLAKPGKTTRLPFMLTHLGPTTSAAPAVLVARVINAHLAAFGHGLRVRPVTYGALLAQRPALPAPRHSTPVSILIPSSLTAPHFLECLEQLLAVTTTPEIEVVVAVGQMRDLDDAQRRIAAMVQRDSRVRVVHLPMPGFNYSSVNNQAAVLTRHPLLLLLNDDVAPIAPGWLDHMVAHLDDARIGIVGPRLLYPDGTVQHGGVILGLGGMCDHASRHLPGDEPGPGARVVLDQELSAVTGACLLVRREVFAAVGGLDETYASAFNDIDFCLRVREAGWGVVYAGSVALTHYELQTYRSHYAGERAAHRNADIARFRQRWADEIAVDPFHNPNMSLVPGQEWNLALPSRIQLWRAVERASEFYSVPRAPELPRGAADASGP